MGPGSSPKLLPPSKIHQKIYFHAEESDEEKSKKIHSVKFVMRNCFVNLYKFVEVEHNNIICLHNFNLEKKIK